jgi:pimeloyl-ACP methyl ester carboxylesterase
MTENFREGSFQTLNSSGPARIAYSDWGPLDGRIIICVHGLTGNGRDFDYLAPALVEDGYRVICPDMPGRGRSDYCVNPLDYTHAQYAKDIQALYDHFGITSESSIDWLGVSMGGLIGFRVAAQVNSPIKRMILNDIGPEVPQAALDFINAVVSQTYRFATMDEFEKRLKETRGLSWGPVTDEQWKHMAKTSVRRLPDGILTYAYDPNIQKGFGEVPIGEIDLWQCWDSLDIPVLALRGGFSLLYTQEIADKMMARSSKMTFETIPGCGHVPSLMAPDQIALIRRWLSQAA